MVLAGCLFITTQSALAQGEGDVEANFIAMLRNAVLKGTWAPLQQGQLGDNRSDSGYRVARVEKRTDNRWTIVSVVTVEGNEVEYPIVASVRFAGDTAVLILDDAKAGPGRANWSARVMFHDDVYAGRWWETGNKEHGGTIAGTIERSE